MRNNRRMQIRMRNTDPDSDRVRVILIKNALLLHWMDLQLFNLLLTFVQFSVWWPYATLCILHTRLRNILAHSWGPRLGMPSRGLNSGQPDSCSTRRNNCMLRRPLRISRTCSLSSGSDEMGPVWVKRHTSVNFQNRCIFHLNDAGSYCTVVRKPNKENRVDHDD